MRRLFNSGVHRFQVEAGRSIIERRQFSAIIGLVSKKNAAFP